MDILELISAKDCENLEIQARALESSKGHHTKHFIVKDGGVEVAFLSLDLIPHTEYLVLYELFVPAAHRRKGIGSSVLSAAEEFARAHNRSKIILNPWPLATGYSQARLTGWYKRHGYRSRIECQTELEKYIA